VIEKIKELGRKDSLIFHKIGLSAGAIVGVVLGLIISEHADEYEVEVLEEVADGAEKNKSE
jgi:hypothetical protein